MANTHSATFDGTGDYATKVSPTGLPSGSAARTIEAWVKTTNALEQAVVSYGENDNPNESFTLSTKTNQLSARVGGDGNQFWTATGVDDGRWHHIALTYVAGSNINDTTNVKAYMDGTALTSASSFSGTPNTVLARIRIGAYSGSVPSGLYNGQIDEVRIWDVVRTQTQLQTNAGIELSGSETNLVGYWNLNNSWNDADSNGNNLTASGDATFTTAIPFQAPTRVNATANLKTNLYAYWGLDESSGNAADSVGSSTLTNTNSITYTTGLVNNAASLASASSQYYTTADSAALSPTGNASWSFWIKPGPTSIGSVADPVVFHKATASNYSYYIQITTTSLTLAASSNGTSFGSATVTLDTMVLTGTWYHLVVLYNAASGKIQVYQNGVSKGTATGTLPTAIFDGTAPLEIGRYGLGASNYYNGMLDEIALYSREVTYGDVLDLYNGGYGIPYDVNTGADAIMFGHFA